MAEADVAAVEYAVTRALKNFDSVVGEEEHTLIRLSLRQGRALSRTVDEKEKLDSISKFADSLIGCRERVSLSWKEVNEAVANLQITWGTYAVKQVESISSARLKYENFLGRASGLSDILEGFLHELEQQDDAQMIIDRLSEVRRAERKEVQVTDKHPALR